MPETDPVVTQVGLTSSEAKSRLEKDGPNSMPDTSAHPFRDALGRLWAPVPWLLETSILIQIGMHKYVEAAVILGLLLFNAGLSYFQEGRAQATLAALKSRLALNASVRRDGVWTTILAAELVRGDLLKLSLGAVVAADVRLVGGSVLLDQSMLTGESLPIEGGPGMDTYAGALVRRGEATAEVTATGSHTKFGRTAELVRTAHGVSSQQRAVLKVVRNLAVFNGFIIVFMGTYASIHALPISELVSLLLTSVLAAIPVALPATFTLAAALGARSLAKLGVLPTRLSAVDEAATVDVLCSDKTGTLTRNELSVKSVATLAEFGEAETLGLAALASSEGGADSVDAAIRAASTRSGSASGAKLPTLNVLIPFDPAKKTSEARVTDAKGGTDRILKGAFSVVADLAAPVPGGAETAARLEKQGFRVLAVAVGSGDALRLIGLIALSDPPRTDSASLISELRGLGVSTVMVTGDAPATASIVAQAVGLVAGSKGTVCPPGPIPTGVKLGDYSVFAGVLPEGKYDLVKAYQANGHAVGMCGDGANDAPALRQAQIGIAVSTATDVAKSAAGVVLTKAGLGGIVAAIKEGRATFQRILTYTLNSVIKKIVQVLLLAIGLLATGHAVLTPMLMIIVMITGDFLAMALTTDRVRPSQMPNSWQIGKLTGAGICLGACFLGFCLAVLTVGKYELGLDIEALRTLSVVALVYGSQATIYAIRERRHFFGLRPPIWLVLASAADILIISGLALRGVAMAPLPLGIVVGELAGAVAFGLVLNVVKIPVFARFGIT